jgi:hypothetical protein
VPEGCKSQVAKATSILARTAIAAVCVQAIRTARAASTSSLGAAAFLGRRVPPPLLLSFGPRVRIDEIGVKPVKTDERKGARPHQPTYLEAISEEDQIKGRVSANGGEGQRADQIDGSSYRSHLKVLRRGISRRLYATKDAPWRPAIAEQNAQDLGPQIEACIRLSMAG